MLFSTLRAPLFALGAYTVGVLAVSAVSDATRDLSPAYDFTQSGAGGYSVEPSNLSIHLDTGDTLKLSRGLAISNPEQNFRYLDDCSEKERESLAIALSSARTYIQTAVTYIRTYRSNGPHYRRWFGKHVRDHLKVVTRVLAALNSYSLAGYTAGCHNPVHGPIIVLYPGRKAIYFREEFWEIPPDRVDESQAMILLAALSTVKDYGGLQKIAKGWEEAEDLASQNHRQVYATANLDNYMEFIISVNRLTITQN